jgi:cerevisin
MHFTIPLLAALSAVVASPIQSVEEGLAPLYAPDNAQPIEHNYIVVFKNGVALKDFDSHTLLVEDSHSLNPITTFSSDGQVEDGGIKHIYKPTTKGGHGFFGYAGQFSPSTLALIRSQPEVAYVELDQIAYTQEMPYLPSFDAFSDSVSSLIDDFKVDSSTHLATEKGAPWGLARISHRNPLKLSTFTRYEYVEEGGEGVDAYVIDTGVNIHHNEFEGRAKWGKTIPKGSKDYDGNGHGSHCAGTIASRKYGVAKGATVIAVKVLGDNGSGSMSDVISGIVWAAEQASEKAAAAEAELAATGKTKHKGSVANMSLGGGKSQATDDAVNAAVDAGLHFAVAAGNDNKDACNYSPAAAKKAVTVGASTLSDTKAYFSNDGPCVDVFAPGLNILSVWSPGNSSSNTISGTSMASPHVCGLLAYLLSIEGTETFSVLAAEESTVSASAYASAFSFLPRIAQTFLHQLSFAPTPKKPTTLTPAILKNALIKLSSKGVLSDLNSKTPNVLVFNNATTAPLEKRA